MYPTIHAYLYIQACIHTYCTYIHTYIHTSTYIHSYIYKSVLHTSIKPPTQLLPRAPPSATPGCWCTGAWWGGSSGMTAVDSSDMPCWYHIASYEPANSQCACIIRRGRYPALPYYTQYANLLQYPTLLPPLPSLSHFSPR
jgi:hypothetical protein